MVFMVISGQREGACAAGVFLTLTIISIIKPKGLEAPPEKTPAEAEGGKCLCVDSPRTCDHFDRKTLGED